MSEEQENTDFVEKLRQMKNDMKTPSVIGDTFNKLEEIKKENEDLKEKIKIKDELIKRSEELLKKTLEAREKLRKENEGALNRLQLDIAEKDEILKQKDKELYELRLKAENSLEEPDIKEKLISISDSVVNEALQLDLQNQIFTLENNVKTLEFTIETLHLEIDKLKKELSEKEEAATIDYVIPVIEPEPAQPEPAQQSNTLETLCQDLQTDLNRYKTIVATLKNENTTLKTNLESKGTPIVVDNTDELKNENLALKSQVSEMTQKMSELQKSLQNAPLEIPKKEDSNIKIRALQEEIREKERRIADLEASTTVQVIATPSGPVSGLVEDLQNQINKLKIALMDKNKVINELKK
jgi:hypothetical protein